MKRFFVLCAFVLATLQVSRQTEAAESRLRPFILTSTYGVVAGTLTGLGSLAFYDKPSENLSNIAMGASLGLYAGILIGAYSVYGAPKNSYDPENPLNDESIQADREKAPSLVPHIFSDSKRAYAGFDLSF